MSGGLRADPGAVLSLLDGPVGSDPGYHIVRCRAVLSLLDGPVGSDPVFYVVWCRFRMLRGHMAKNSSVHELARVYGLLRVVAAGAPGHGPVHLLLSSAASLGFSWDSDFVWRRLGLPGLCRLLFGMLGEPRSLARAGFRCGRYLDFRGALKLLSSPERRGQRAFAWYFLWECLEWISSRLCQRRNRSLPFLWKSGW